MAHISTSRQYPHQALHAQRLPLASPRRLASAHQLLDAQPRTPTAGRSRTFRACGGTPGEDGGHSGAPRRNLPPESPLCPVGRKCHPHRMRYIFGELFEPLAPRGDLSSPRQRSERHLPCVSARVQRLACGPQARIVPFELVKGLLNYGPALFLEFWALAGQLGMPPTGVYRPIIQLTPGESALCHCNLAASFRFFQAATLLYTYIAYIHACTHTYMHTCIHSHIHTEEAPIQTYTRIHARIHKYIA